VALLDRWELQVLQGIIEEEAGCYPAATIAVDEVSLAILQDQTNAGANLQHIIHPM